MIKKTALRHQIFITYRQNVFGIKKKKNRICWHPNHSHALKIYFVMSFRHNFTHWRKAGSLLYTSHCGDKLGQADGTHKHHPHLNSLWHAPQGETIFHPQESPTHRERELPSNRALGKRQQQPFFIFISSDCFKVPVLHSCISC